MNRLAREKSPYLLQHAENPVDWYPWGEEAFEKARRENKPVFLSIGYSTCHWCHVMAHESFEDPEVAGLMNEAFVPVKVDREERPDLDNLYMTVCQMLTGSGGWPLTVLLTPDKKPFFAGTYFPKKNRFGQIGMLDLVPRIRQIWESRHDEVVASAQQIAQDLSRMTREIPGAKLEREVLDQAYAQLTERFDAARGGFGAAPKFPTPHQLLFLLRYATRTGSSEARGMVEKTLEAMRRGGLYDHIGFGFHRYAVDSEWLVPHFEKMLYDQAMLVMAYTEAYQVTGRHDFADAVHETVTYVLRDLAGPEGAFYSSEDADSEGEEGKFYLWTVEELREVLSPKELDLACRIFHADDGGNFYEEATRQRTGRNILHLIETPVELLGDPRLPEIRKKLFEAREKRVRPHRDDKILADWNGLFVAALAKATSVFDKPEWMARAEQAVTFVFSRMVDPGGRLLHRFRDGEAAIRAYLNDYAFLIWGLIDLYETTFNVEHLKRALKLQDELDRHFWNREGGGYFFTADDAESLLWRHKETYDGAVPSGNSVAMQNLLRLSLLTGNIEFEEKADAILRIFTGSVRQVPMGYTQFLCAYDYSLGPSCAIVLVGDLGDEGSQRMARAIRQRFFPNKAILFKPSKDPLEIAKLAPFAEPLNTLDGKATAYVCVGNTCQLPTTSEEELLTQRLPQLLR